MIFIDIDGVVADFVGQAIMVNGGDPERIKLQPGNWRVDSQMGMPADAFWSRIDAGGEYFWANLGVYDWARTLVDTMQSIAPIAFLSSPSKSPACHAGKVRWLQRFMGADFRGYHFTPASHKRFLAGPERVLIDDCDANCQEWDMAGGKAILFPQVWNSQHDQIPVDYREWIECTLAPRVEFALGQL